MGIIGGKSRPPYVAPANGGYEQLIATTNKVAEILERLTLAPMKVVQDTIDYPTLPMKPLAIVSRTQLDGLNEVELRIWKYLEANPAATKLSVRKLGEATDTSKTTAADILRRYKQSNGNE